MNQNRILDAIREVHEQWKGGSGSGNFGHAGRPGKHGGSAGGGGKGGPRFAARTPTVAEPPPMTKTGTKDWKKMNPKQRKEAHAQDLYNALPDSLKDSYAPEPSTGGIRVLRGTDIGSRKELGATLRAAGFKPIDRVEREASERIFEHPKTGLQLVVFTNSVGNKSLGKPGPSVAEKWGKGFKDDQY